MKTEWIEAVKKEMGYSDGTDCCAACAHHVECDCSGSMNAKPEHCTRNAFDVPVKSEGRCTHFTKNIRV